MNSDETQRRESRSFSEALNSFSVFLCSTALRELRNARSPQDMDAWFSGLVASAAPLFRRLADTNKQRHALERPLARLAEFAREGMSLDSPELLSELRATVRNLFDIFGVPGPPTQPGAACELHGARCPELGE